MQRRLIAVVVWITVVVDSSRHERNCAANTLADGRPLVQEKGAAAATTSAAAADVGAAAVAAAVVTVGSVFSVSEACH